MVLKKLVKPLKNATVGPSLCEKGVRLGYTQNEKQILFSEMTKTDHKLSETLFYQNPYVLDEL